MKICNRCGTQFADNIEICPRCGNVVASAPNYYNPQPNIQNNPYAQRPAQPQPPVQPQPVAQNPIQGYTSQEKSVFNVTEGMANAPQNNPYGAAPQGYAPTMNAAPNPYGYPMQGGVAVKKKNTGLIIGIVAAVVVVFIIFAAVIGSFLTKPIEEKVGTVSTVDRCYTNSYADITLKAPNSNWTIKNYDEILNDVNNGTVETDKNGRKCLKKDGITVYHEALLSYFSNAATAQVMIMGVDELNGNTIIDLTEAFVKGMNDNYILTQVDSGKQDIAGKEYNYYSYSGSYLLVNIYGKVYIRALDTKTAIAIIIFSTDQSDITDITSNIS